MSSGRRNECKTCHHRQTNRAQSVRRADAYTGRNVKPEREPVAGVVVRPDRLEKHLVFTDPHVPHHDMRSCVALWRYMSDERWDGVHCLGDLTDNDAISSFNDGLPRRVSNALTVSEQFEAGQAFIRQWASDARHHNPDCALTLLEGNHEERTERYVDRNPELQGLVDIERGLDLKTHGIRYLRFWSRGEMLQLGKLMLGHGSYATQNHAAAHVRHYGCNMLYGHTHDVQCHSIRRRGTGTPITAQSIGCLCRFDQPYMRGRPHNWEHAFAVVYVWPGGNFQHVVTRIMDGRFVAPTNGKEYSA